MKLRYILYSAVGILLHTSCNDAFLERSSQDLNDNTFWTSTGDLRTYANAFYDILPGGVTNYGDTDADDQVPSSIDQFLWGQYVVPTEDDLWSKSNWANIRNINYFMTHYGTVTGAEKDINVYVAEMRFSGHWSTLIKLRPSVMFLG